jgi:lysophospholipase L1-like esterase
MFDGVINNYTEAAHKTGSLLCPVGKIWKEHFEKTSDYSYYGPDNFHPSVAGSKAAAAVIFETLNLKATK